MTSVAWRTDLLGPDFQACEIALGSDPDGEGEITATLIRHSPAEQRPAPATEHPHAVPDPHAVPSPHAVLYLHGFTDYFFQRHIAEHFASRGFTFYALDLRKCGRSLRPGHTPHFVRDLTSYDAEIEAALEIIRTDTPGTDTPGGQAEAPPKTLLVGHSTGGLVLPLWLDRLRRAGAGRHDDPPDASAARLHRSISGLVLNSPWFDLQGKPARRSVGTLAIDALGRMRPTATIPTEPSVVYGSSLHESYGGEWSYDLDWKPLTGFPVVAGWLRAVRIGHARLHRGLDVGVPSLVLRSNRTVFGSRPSAATISADTVVDVNQIARWSGCLGGQNAIVPVEGALHDVFLSAPPVRARAFAVVDEWLDAVGITDAVGIKHAVGIRRAAAGGAFTAAGTGPADTAAITPDTDTDPHCGPAPHHDKETTR